jgi:hypothetical protein
MATPYETFFKNVESDKKGASGFDRSYRIDGINIPVLLLGASQPKKGSSTCLKVWIGPLTRVNVPQKNTTAFKKDGTLHFARKIAVSVINSTELQRNWGVDLHGAITMLDHKAVLKERDVIYIYVNGNTSNLKLFAPIWLIDVKAKKALKKDVKPSVPPDATTEDIEEEANRSITTYFSASYAFNTMNIGSSSDIYERMAHFYYGVLADLDMETHGSDLAGDGPFIFLSRTQNDLGNASRALLDIQRPGVHPLLLQTHFKETMKDDDDNSDPNAQTAFLSYQKDGHYTAAARWTQFGRSWPKGEPYSPNNSISVQIAVSAWEQPLAVFGISHWIDWAKLAKMILEHTSFVYIAVPAESDTRLSGDTLEKISGNMIDTTKQDIVKLLNCQALAFDYSATLQKVGFRISASVAMQIAGMITNGMFCGKRQVEQEGRKRSQKIFCLNECYGPISDFSDEQYEFRALFPVPDSTISVYSKYLANMSATVGDVMISMETEKWMEPTGDIIEYGGRIINSNDVPVNSDPDDENIFAVADTRVVLAPVNLQLRRLGYPFQKDISSPGGVLVFAISHDSSNWNTRSGDKAEKLKMALDRFFAGMDFIEILDKVQKRHEGPQLPLLTSGPSGATVISPRPVIEFPTPGSIPVCGPVRCLPAPAPVPAVLLRADARARGSDKRSRSRSPSPRPDHWKAPRMITDEEE